MPCYFLRVNHRNAHGASDRYPTDAQHLSPRFLQLEQNEENDETAEVTWGTTFFFLFLF